MIADKRIIVDFRVIVNKIMMKSENKSADRSGAVLVDRQPKFEHPRIDHICKVS